MGGVQGALMVCLEFLLLPIAEYCYFLKVIKRLFLAQTSDEHLFKETTHSHCKKMNFDDKDSKFAIATEKNRVI